MKNPMPEPSLLLDLKQSKWSIVKERISTITEDPFNEISKDEVVAVKASRNRRTKGFWNFWKQPAVSIPQKSTKPKPVPNGGLLNRHKAVNGTQRPDITLHQKSTKPQPVPNGGLPNRHKAANGTFVINRSKTTYVQTEKPKIERANTSSFNADILNVTHEEAQTQALTNDSNEVSLATQNFTEINTKEHHDLQEAPKSGKTAGVNELSLNDKPMAKKPPNVPNKRGIQNNNRRSLITWTGKRLVRSKSNISARLTRGLTSTRLGSITEGKSNSSKEKPQRRQSESDTPSGQQQQSAGKSCRRSNVTDRTY